ncbi:MAG: U32 family peptidase [Bacteroidales bacterium]|nr:U32 family peptidase [Bacteroidales bacterium]
MQLKQLELLAPAKDKEIGIAAIDCGADAVYIAGPRFGAREAAGNSVEDIAELASYAHRFGARIFIPVNTILYEDEIEDAQRLIHEVYEAGADALIVQDLGILRMKLPPVELHASTQTAIRNAEQAKLLEGLGFTRLVLERQLSLDEIKSIRQAVSCELETFIHGALCVCYSGNCYLSERLAGRSANRGACIQACRSDYDLVDEDGKVLAHNKKLLSLKDLKWDDRIGDLAQAGICSFKIEGRLKNISYVKNVVRHYREATDRFITANEGYCRSSFGEIHGGFKPDLNATFNRGYTSLFIDGRKGEWNSGDAAKSMGEYIGKVTTVGKDFITVDSSSRFAGGDGLAFVAKNGDIIGSRVEKSEGDKIYLKDTSALFKGQAVYRNFNKQFEKEIKDNSPQRLIPASVTFDSRKAVATTVAGITATYNIEQDFPVAVKKDVAINSIKNQLEKIAGDFIFKVTGMDTEDVRFYPASFLNGVRRSLAEELSRRIVENHLKNRRHNEIAANLIPLCKGNLDYSANCSNNLSAQVYKELGFGHVDPAYELSHKGNAELMRTRYCIKYELALCPKNPLCKNGMYNKELFLVNGGRKLRLFFDCKQCEMVIF